MPVSSLLPAVALAVYLGSAYASGTTSVSDVCANISQSISSASAVFYPPSATYQADISHWAASSTNSSVCSVEPGSAADVGTILRIVGATRTPFAVKGGGHATNPGFSSTPGVQISMARFSEVVYNAGSQTVDVGPGLIWDDVYAQLEPFGVNVVGGRSSGVGVAGFSLGGGYSWLTNQYGLTVDNTVGYELVLPNGTVTSVTEAGNPDLFFSLKGGYNNFGVVTKFTFKAYPQGQVWGGLRAITGDHLPEVSAATAKFASQVTDPKAAVLPTYNFVQGVPIVSLLMFYDAPTPPAGIFDDYLAIPALEQDVSTRSFLSLVQSSAENITAGTRATFNTVSLTQLTSGLLDAVANETLFWGPKLSNGSAVFVSYDIEPFLASIFTHGSTATSAYPPDRSRGLLPLNIYYAWTNQADDAAMKTAAIQSAQQLVNVADAEGQNIAGAPLYGNYAGPDTPVGRIFGGSLARMGAAKAVYDPQNVMGLAGGWKV